MHKIEEDKVYDIIQNIEEFLNNIRKAKIKKLEESYSIAYSDDEAYRSLRSLEASLDKKNRIAEIVEYATIAEKVIKRHHPSQKVESFLKACSNYSGSNYNQYKSVVVVEQGFGNRYIITKVAHSHPTASVISGENTRYYS